MSDDPFELGAPDLGHALSRLGDAQGRLRIDPETVEADLARLVLAIMAFLREIMELQAIRRMENGTLSAEEEEKVGTTLMRAEDAIHDMAAKFGLSPSDLSLDLGPLGRTI